MTAKALERCLRICVGLALVSPSALNGQPTPRVAIMPFNVFSAGPSNGDPSKLVWAIRGTLLVEFMDRGLRVIEPSALGALLEDSAPPESAGAEVDGVLLLLEPQAVFVADRFRMEIRVLDVETRVILSTLRGVGDLASIHQTVMGMFGNPAVPLGLPGVAPPEQTGTDTFLPLRQFEAFGEAIIRLDEGALDQAVALLEEIADAFPDFAPAQRLLEGAERAGVGRL